MRSPQAPPAAIGWREWASLPDLGVKRIKAKIDTGAKTSAIHAFRIKTSERGGETHVEFAVHPAQRKRKPEIVCHARVIDKRRIRSSNGAVEERLIIEARLRLGDREFMIELSLADRDSMGFRLLLGRDALKKSFVIHPGRSFRLGK